MPEPKKPFTISFERKPAPTEPSGLQIEFDDTPYEPATGFLAGAPQAATPIERAQERAPRPNAELVASYQEFQRALQLSPEDVKNIYHPACGTDISPSVAFPDSHVTYVDHMSSAVQDLTTHGYDALCVDANTFALPAPADVLIVMNADHEFSPTIPLQQVRDGGYVLCNEYNSDAFKISKQPGVKCLGRIEEHMNNGSKEYAFNNNAADVETYFARKQAQHDTVPTMTQDELARYMLNPLKLSGVIVFQVVGDATISVTGV